MNRFCYNFILLCMLLLSIIDNSNAQLIFSNDTVKLLNAPVGVSISLKDTLFNNSSSPIAVTWRKIAEYNNSNWNLQSVCDPNYCYLANFESLHSFSVPANGYSLFYPTLRATETTTGCCILLFEMEWLGNTKNLVFIMSIDSNYTDCLNPLELDEFEKNNYQSFIIFPNPSNNVININFVDLTTMSNYKLKIVSAMGQTILEKSINENEFQVDLGKFGSKGLYLAYILDERMNIVETRKILFN